MVQMTRKGSSTRHNIVTRCLAALALVLVYSISLIGSSIVLVASTGTADARGGGGRGGGRGGGFRGGGFRGGGFRGRGYGRGYGYGPRCFYNRFGRLVCPYY